MNIKHTLLALCAFAALTATAADSADEARLNEIGAEQIRLQNETRGIIETLEHELRSEKYDTPEMKEIRVKIAELKEQLRLAETELRRQFEQAPEVRERAKVKNANLARLHELYDERNAILKKREEAKKRATPQAEEPAAEEQPAPAAEPAPAEEEK